MRNNARAIVLQTKTSLSEADSSSNPEVISQIRSQCEDDLVFLNELLECCNNVLDQRVLISAIAEMNDLRRIIEKKEMFLNTNNNSANEQMTSTLSAETIIDCQDINTAFENRLRTVVLVNKKHIDPKQFLADSCDVLKIRLDSVFKTEEVLKIAVILSCEYKVVRDDEERFKRIYTPTKCAPLFKTDDFKIWFTKHIQKAILLDIDKFNEPCSGWALSAIVDLKVNINKYTMLVGCSYIDLPLEIKAKKACVNVQNEDDACFGWAVVSALHPIKGGSNRTTSYPHYKDVLNLNGITFPVTIEQIPRFERQNNISINVFILKLNTEDRKENKYNVLPTYVSKNTADKHINLLLIQSEYTDDNCPDSNCQSESDMEPLRYHYVWIKRLSTLVSSNLSHNRSTKHICNRCLHYFNKPTVLKKHMEECSQEKTCKIRLPPKPCKNICFESYMRKRKTPFIIYANAEYLYDKSKRYQIKVPYNAGYYIKCSFDPTLSFYKSYRGENCISWLTRELRIFAEKAVPTFNLDVTKTPMTARERKQFEDSTLLQLCYICEKPIKDNTRKVRTNCRFTGTYNGPSHEVCNMNFVDNWTIPVYFHNLSEYDSHVLIQNFESNFEGRIRLNSIPMNQSLINFTKHTDCRIKFRFMDSFQFVGGDLLTMSSYSTGYPILQSEFSHLSQEELELLTAKSGYPHEYFDDALKLKQTTLPPVEAFSEVNEYIRAKRIWHLFGISDLGEYSDLCLKTKVLLLADHFEVFRTTCMDKYVLDPTHYLTLSDYAWDVMLKYTNISLELLTDSEMLLFIERGTRCGLNQCSKSYSKATNKYLENYISTDIPTYLMFFGLDNKCDWAMSQHLPHGHFKWVEDFNDFDVELIPDDSPIGYILEVDLEYPTYLHDRHKDLPFFPEYESATNSEEELLTTLNDKNKYVLHYRNLKQALEHGLKVTKIHKLLGFEQSPWLKSYVDLNRSLAKSAKNNFERNLFALMNYAIFERSTEDFKGEYTAKLIMKWYGRYGAESFVSKPEFKLSTIISEELVAVEAYKNEVVLNKPVYIGMCLLDLAKTRLYEFHYQYMKRKFEQNCSICYIDTDSLLYEITAIDVYESIREDCQQQFDTSDYPPDNIWNIPRVNAKALGLMKDRNNGRVMTEFVGLKSKMYAMRTDERHKPIRQRGIDKEITARRITFADYMTCFGENCAGTELNQ